jgi:CBS domain-containing protein
MPPHVPHELQQIAQLVAKGERPQVSVRVLISWFFGAQRRGRWTVGLVREALTYLKLTTNPDFDWIHLDGLVTISPNEGVPVDGSAATSSVTPTELSQNNTTSDQPIVNESIDPTFRIGRLDIANKPPVWVSPNATVQEAITIMLKNDFSQLPVMRNERDVKGLFSWRSLGIHRWFGQEVSFVHQSMESCPEVTVDASLFAVTEVIRASDCVLVRDVTQKISGIVTAYDISITFGQLGEPFLLLGEIENHIRSLIGGKFTKADLQAVRDPADSIREIRGIPDLTLGEYLRLLENNNRWDKLAIPIDRGTFVKDLDGIRRIRNEVMHFDPEGLDDKDLGELRDFVYLLQRIHKFTLGRA